MAEESPSTQPLRANEKGEKVVRKSRVSDHSAKPYFDPNKKVLPFQKSLVFTDRAKQEEVLDELFPKSADHPRVVERFFQTLLYQSVTMDTLGLSPKESADNTKAAKAKLMTYRLRYIRVLMPVVKPTS